jgi:hypothetical protein
MMPCVFTHSDLGARNSGGVSTSWDLDLKERAALLAAEDVDVVETAAWVVATSFSSDANP